jgi:RimJ/RimL family protein N-acetyltransferase
MLDKSVKYYEVLMKRPKGAPLQEFTLPEGYKFVSYQPNDEKEWAEIETSVGEFERAVDALVYFQKCYMSYRNELEKRCIFIENPEGKKIGTATAWFMYTGVRRDPWLHWFAIKPEYQGLALGKAMCYEVVRKLLEIEGDRDFYLHTQTWSYKAINIYRKEGFFITDEKPLGGFQNNDYEAAVELLKDYLR